MPKKLGPDWVLFLVTLVLAIFGIVMVFSSSAVMAKEVHGNPNYFSFKQLLAATLGLALMFLIMKVDYRKYRKPILVFSILSVAIGTLVLVYFLAPSANAHRWIQFPGISFQPSELAKIALVFFLAYFLEKQKGQVNNIQFTLAPIAVVAGLLAVLIVMEPDLGTVVAMMLTAAVLLFVAGLDVRWFAVSAVLSTPILYILIFSEKYKYRLGRITTFLHPSADPLGAGYHINQSLISVGSGGIFGLGYMEGKQKLFFLPEAHTDFIYAVIGEELGLIGTIAILVLFSIFLWRGVRTAVKAPDAFGFYLGLGITMMVAIQAFINMSVVLALMPTKGIPLPFLSYGGSSFVIMLASVGILLNISQHSSS